MTSPHRLLLIHQAFATPTEGGGTRHYELGERLCAHGHHFTVVRSDRSFLTGEEVRECAPEAAGGIRIVRAYTHPSLHRSYVSRVASYVSFAATSVLKALRTGEFDVVMGTSPPIFQAVSALAIAEVRRRPFLLEIRDLWPDFAIDIGVLRNPLLIAASRWLESFLYRRADQLLVNSPAYRDYLMAKGIPRDKVTLIPNGVDPSMFDPQARGESVRSEFALGDKFVIVYAGALGMANDLEVLLAAAAKLREANHIHFLVVGDGKERKQLQALAQELRLQNLSFAGAQPKHRMREFLGASDACVAILKNIKMFRTTYPNKVFDYMASGRPTILAIDGVIRDVIEASGGGLFVPPGDSDALAEAAQRLSSNREQADAMGRNAREYVVKHFHRDQHAEQLLAVVEALAARTRFRTPLWKRTLDLLLGSVALFVFLPVVGVAVALLRISLGKPVLFRHERAGFLGRPFTAYKLRTMTDERASDGTLLPDERRLTRMGAVLRSLSLDELPQLINVLRGEMSLVGPRPLLMRYLERYSRRQARRHEVLPGITGWAQIKGRNALSWEEKFELDVWYVENRSFWVDVKILFLTVWKVLRRSGISQKGQATVEEFRGSHASGAAAGSSDSVAR
jgi:lipopolysaccharide/colanic/teichoic acid biosynthesis glycosyltransferase